jgi:tight adherence protein B
MTGLVAAGAAAGAAALLTGGPWRTGRLRPSTLRHDGLVVAGVVGAVGAAVAVVDGTELVVVLLGLALVVAGAREVGRRRRAVAAEHRTDQLLAACDALAADLRAGQPPVTALAAAAADWSELAPVVAAARLGSDVPDALRDLADLPGAAQARVVAAAWQVAHRSGAGLAGALALAAGHLRDDRATARVVATEMAAAQATARLLAVLPLGVLLLGNGLGGDPVGFLLGTPPGLVCLTTGLALEYAGLSWLAGIADRILGRR